MIDESARHDVALRSLAPEDVKRRTIRGGAIGIVGEGLDFFLRVGVTALLARLVVPESFGIIAMVTAVTAIAERFKDLGLSLATVQQREIRGDQIDALFWVNVALGIVLTCVVALAAWPLAAFYSEPRVVPVTLALAASFAFGGLTVQHQALLRRHMQFGRLAGVQLSASVLSALLAIVMALEGTEVWSLVAREVARSLLVCLGTWLAMPWRPGLPRRTTELRQMLSFGGDVTAFNLIWFFAGSVDQIALGKVFGPAQLGFYRQGVTLAYAPLMQVSYVVTSVAESTLSRLQDLPDSFRAAYRRFLGALALVVVPAGLFVAVLAEEIVAVLLGDRWAPAATFFRILAFAAPMKALASTVGFVMVTTGRTRRYVWWGLCNSLALVTFVLIGLKLGPSGIAWAHVAATFFVLLPLIGWSLRDTPVAASDFFAAIRAPLFAGAGMASVVWLYKHYAAGGTPILTLSVGALIGALAYFALLASSAGGRLELSRARQTLDGLLQRQAA